MAQGNARLLLEPEEELICEALDVLFGQGLVGADHPP